MGDQSNPTRKDNGSGEKKHHTIVLAFEPTTSALHIDFDVVNFDMALAMLHQAERFVEGKLRIAAAVAAQAEIAQAQKDAQIAAAVRGQRH